jgi:hypothetical protein
MRWLNPKPPHSTRVLIHQENHQKDQQDSHEQNEELTRQASMQDINRFSFHWTWTGKFYDNLRIIYASKMPK